MSSVQSYPELQGCYGRNDNPSPLHKHTTTAGSEFRFEHDDLRRGSASRGAPVRQGSGPEPAKAPELARAEPTIRERILARPCDLPRRNENPEKHRDATPSRAKTQKA